MQNKERLDVAVARQGSMSRQRASAVIMAGDVYVNNQKSTKSGDFVTPDDIIEIRAKEPPFVSRGGYKLSKAVESFGLELKDCICMDIGASTGGFSDCMLQNGASKVYAVDVGYGQLAWKLRNDNRVVNMERTNFRYLTENDINEPIDFASVDVSFISLKKILPVLFNLLKDDGKAVCLIKPQFEAGRDKVGKKGVVRDKAVHAQVIADIKNFALENGFSTEGFDFSPIKGPEGNIEYLMLIKKSDSPADDSEITPEELADLSHQTLDV